MNCYLPTRKHFLKKRFILPLMLIIAFTLRTQAQAIIEHSRMFTSAGGSTTNRELIVEGAYSYVLANVTGIHFPITIGTAPTNTNTKSVLLKLDTAGHIIWSRYLPLGGSSTSTTYQHMVLSNGVLYLLGFTTATDIPVTNGSVAGGGGNDILFTKIDASNGSILHNGYLGGNGTENTGLGLAVENGNVFITYATQSSNIPITTGPAYTSGYDHVVQKIGTSGNFMYSTYTGSVSTTAVNTDSITLIVQNGIAYLGTVVSSTNNFITTDGSTVSGAYDYGMIRLDASGNKTFSTVIGGTATESRPVLLVDNGNMYIAGLSNSPNFPVTNGSVRTGALADLTITKLNNSGAVVFSGYYAGFGNVLAGVFHETPVMQLDGGSLYITGGSYGASPVSLTTTDGSSGKYYLIKLNAANGTVQFASLFGATSHNFAARTGADLVVKDGAVYALASSLNMTGAAFTTDGTTRTGNSGTFVVKYTTSGQILFASWLTGNATNFGSTYKLAVTDGKLFVSGSASGAFPLTEAPEGSFGPNAGGDVTWTVYSFCPSMPATNTITPLTQTVCQEGFTQSLTGNQVAYPSSQMPLIYRGGVAQQQNEIPARYQWQVATSAGGPWTNISGPGTQKDYTPPIGTQTRYYRRLVLPPAGCGDTPVSTSAVAEVLIGTNAAPTVTGGVFTTCVNTAINISATASGGTAPYTYAWDNGIASTTNTATVTPTGNSVYTMTVTDVSGCQQVGQVIVNAYTADAGPATVSSCAGNPVRIGTAPPAGLAGVTYSWTPTTGLDDPTVAQPLATPASNIVYTLQMTIPVSGGGTCVTSDNIAVNVVAAPVTTNFAGPDQAVCKGGTLNLGAAGEAGFTYTWSPGNYLTTTSASTTTFNAGSELSQPNPLIYTLTASTQGCSFTDQVRVSALAVDAGEDYCGPRTVGTPDMAPGVTGKTYFWEVLSGTGTITGATNTAMTTVSASSGSSTSYRVTVSYLGASCMDTVVVPAGCGGGCPNIDIEVVAEHGCPSAGLGSVTLQAIPSNLSASQWTYSWSAIPAGGLSGTTGNTVMLTDNIERDVTVTITRVDNPAFTCSETIHVNGPSWSIPAFNGSDRTICPTTSVSIGAPVAGYTYTWQNVNPGDENLDNPSVSPLNTTDYPVVITDIASGCTLNDTVKVTVNPLVVNPGPDWTTCSNALITLGSPALPGYTYTWNPAVANYQNGTTFQSAQPQVLVAASQNFTITVTDTQTGCSDDSTVVITIDNSNSLPPMTNMTICPGASVKIGPPALSGVTYSWSPAVGLSSTTVAQPDASPGTTQTYTLTITYYDAGGAPTCTKSGSVTITVDAPQITMSDAVVCPSNPLYNLSTGVSVTGSPVAYEWSPAILVTNPTSFSTTVRANPRAATTFTLIATDANGCSDTASKVVSPTNIPPPDAGSAGFVCVGGNRTLGVPTNNGILSWTANPAIAGTLSPANGAQPVFTPATADANKTITFTVSQDIGGCINTDSVKILVRNLTLPAMPSQTVCMNGSATIGTAAQPYVSYSWTPATGLTNPSAATTTINSVTANSIYTLTATDAYGCYASASTAVGVSPIPAPTVTIPDVTVQLGSPGIPFSPQISPMSGSYIYTWTPSQRVNNPYISNATAIPGGVGSYIYELTVTDANGCTVTAQARLNVVMSTLPVTLSTFSGSVKNCDVQLDWKVLTADKFSHFVVERNNGLGFQPVGTIHYDARNELYRFIDVGPGDGNWMYRLKLVDMDGSIGYSKTTLAKVNCSEKASMVIYPNPLSDRINIRSDKPVRKVSLFGVGGQLLMQREYTQGQAGVITMQVERQLGQGIYILQVIAIDGTVQNAKLIKQ